MSCADVQRLRMVFAFGLVLGIVGSVAVADTRDEASPEVPSPLRFAGLADGDRVVEHVFDLDAYHTIKRRAAVTITGLVAAPTQPFDLQVEQFWVTNGQTQYLRDGEAASTSPDVVLLRGHVVGAPESRAVLGLSPFGSNGLIEHAGDVYVISTYAPDAARPTERITVSYRRGDMPAAEVEPWQCELIPVPGAPITQTTSPAAPLAGQPAGAGGIARAGNCLEAVVAIETDHEFFLIFGSEAAANAYIVEIVGVASTIYERDTGMRLTITFQRLWTTPADPWELSGVDELYEFQDYWNAHMQHIQRTSAHLFSGKGGGGVAYFPGVCYPEYDYALSNVSGSFPRPPLSKNPGNWDIHVVTHEWGHIYGGPHTHALTPPIDTCASNCPSNPQGTIMSYCHICPGGETNIVLEFHARIQQLIRDQVASVGCITQPISCDPLLRGDLNCDGRFNGADIDPFFLALGDPAAYRTAFPNCDFIVLGDMDSSGFFNGSDIDLFFDALGGP